MQITSYNDLIVRDCCSRKVLRNHVIRVADETGDSERTSWFLGTCFHAIPLYNYSVQFVWCVNWLCYYYVCVSCTSASVSLPVSRMWPWPQTSWFRNKPDYPGLSWTWPPVPTNRLRSISLDRDLLVQHGYRVGCGDQHWDKVLKFFCFCWACKRHGDCIAIKMVCEQRLNKVHSRLMQCPHSRRYVWISAEHLIAGFKGKGAMV